MAEHTDNRRRRAPISWGVCEVPGWGHQLAPERVFGEIASLGLRATELGPVGYLPFEPAAIREALDRHGLRLVGGFVPLVLHEPALDTTAAERCAAVLAGAGAEVFNAAVVADEAWSPPLPLDDDAFGAWRATSPRSSAWSSSTGSRSRCTRTRAPRSRRRPTWSGCWS